MSCCAIKTGLYCFAIKVEGEETWNEGVGDQIHEPMQILKLLGQAAHQLPGPHLPSAIQKGLTLKPGCAVFTQAQFWIITTATATAAATTTTTTPPTPLYKCLAWQDLIKFPYTFVRFLQLSLLTSRWQQILTGLGH